MRGKWTKPLVDHVNQVTISGRISGYVNKGAFKGEYKDYSCFMLINRVNGNRITIRVAIKPEHYSKIEVSDETLNEGLYLNFLGTLEKKDEDGRLFIVADKVVKLDENIEINRATLIGRLDSTPKVYKGNYKYHQMDWVAFPIRIIKGQETTVIWCTSTEPEIMRFARKLYVKKDVYIQGTVRAYIEDANNVQGDSMDIVLEKIDFASPDLNINEEEELIDDPREQHPDWEDI